MEGITKSVQYALRRYGIEEPDLEKLTPFIGPPLRDSFMKFYRFSKEQAGEAVYVYREYFTEKGMFENRELPGIRSMLEHLKAAGKTLLVATSKPEPFARKILEHFSMDGYFDFIGGADMGETRVKKGDVIRYVLEHAGITAEEKGRAVMVGDREHDIWGAAENGLTSIGV
ncbi:MAG: HAD hydrolase-like protein, partial [Lachnospiraceae bacterium]|nr:HAD hydrolase-like protein [Lachnospiraceae bacterium]